ncbi:MAG: AAA family ATPase [Clostridia bacterium]|nr:AAA family ATPase [Clostridia bacterium]
MEEKETLIQLEERQHFDAIMALIAKRLEAAKQESEAQLRGLQDTRRDEFTERSEPMLKNLWAAHRFEDLVHLSQEFQNAAEEEKDHESTLQRISSLQKAQSTPYFARIDLTFDEDDTEMIYIGRRSLWDDEKENLLIYDWRAPLASVFYRFGTGKAYYQAPAGRIDCALTLKRQFEIASGRLIGFFDADTVIQDSFLRRLLAQNASSQMKAIVETIQRDQDAAIRDENHDLLMVQGAAGSGKTSIAMHRVAYLMYEGLKSPLKAHHILILSPNTVFEKYISSVLPELGESRVDTITMEQMLEELLESPVQSRLDRWEEESALPENMKAQREKRRALLSSPAFSGLLDRFAAWLPAHLPCADLSYGGRVVMSREEIRSTARDPGSRFPLAVRLRQLEDALWERVHALRKARLDELRMLAFRLGHGEEYARGVSIWESGVLAKEAKKVTRINALSLYRELLARPEVLFTLGRGVFSREELCLLTARRPDPYLPLPLEDAAAAAYLKLRLTFGHGFGDKRQVVVDEAQDYTPMDYAVLNLLFPKARFTVVGDIHQSLEQKADESLYACISDTLRRKNPVLLTLNKSFRCTREILEFSLRFLPGQAIECLNRSGSEPKILPLSELTNEIEACRAAGYESVALIAKTRSDAEAWQARLPREWNVKLMGRSARLGSVFLAPLPLCKGLEFDAALILDCDRAHYGRQEDRKLLYVACTRALHRLALFTGEDESPLLQKEAPHA